MPGWKEATSPPLYATRFCGHWRALGRLIPCTYEAQFLRVSALHRVDTHAGVDHPAEGNPHDLQAHNGRGPDEPGLTSSPPHHPLLLFALAPVAPYIPAPRPEPDRAQFGAPRAFLRFSFCVIPPKATRHVLSKSLDSTGAGGIFGASGEATLLPFTALKLFLRGSFWSAAIRNTKGTSYGRV